MSVITRPVRSPAPALAVRRTERAHGLRAAVSSRVYLPACSIVAVAAVLVGIGWANHWGGADFVGAMGSLRVVVIGPLTLLILGVFLVVERLRPAQRRPLFARGYRQDLLYTVLNATLTVPLVTALTLSSWRGSAPYRAGAPLPLSSWPWTGAIGSPIWRTTASRCSGASTRCTIHRRT
jgi:hypothetical protein